MSEAISLRVARASITLTSPPSPRKLNPTKRTPSSPSRSHTASSITGSASVQGPSRVLATLDTHFPRREQHQDDEIEVFGPFKPPPHLSNATSLDRGSENQTARMPVKLLHPFFKTAASAIRSTTTIPALLGTVKPTRNIGPLSRSIMSASTASTSLSMDIPPTLLPPPIQRPSIKTAKPRKPRAKPMAVDPNIPLYSYRTEMYPPESTSTPTVIYTRHEQEANELCSGLLARAQKTYANGDPIPLVLGFDTEWRVLWRSGMSERPTALIQLASENEGGMIYLIQVSAMTRFPEKLKEVLESPTIVKTGANILNDGVKLWRDFGLYMNGLVELGMIASQADPENPFLQKNGRPYVRKGIVALAKVVERYCGKTLSKGPVRTSNWEARLNEEQIEYAANDAHCALVVYKKLTDMAATHQRTLQPAMYTRFVLPGGVGNIIEEVVEVKEVIPEAPEAPATLAEETISVVEPPRLPSRALTFGMISNGMRPQFLRAYSYWHDLQMDVEEMRRALSTRGPEDPLQADTVISYIVSALQKEPTLPYDLARLNAMIRSDAGSWRRHRQWMSMVGNVTQDANLVD